MNRTEQAAQIIHLQGMLKGFKQLSEIIASRIERIESRIEEIREQPADE